MVASFYLKIKFGDKLSAQDQVFSCPQEAKLTYWMAERLSLVRLNLEHGFVHSSTSKGISLIDIEESEFKEFFHRHLLIPVVCEYGDQLQSEAFLIHFVDCIFEQYNERHRLLKDLAKKAERISLPISSIQKIKIYFMVMASYAVISAVRNGILVPDSNLRVLDCPITL